MTKKTTDLSISSIGIVGLGSFGQFVASKVPDGITIYGYDSRHDITLTDTRIKHVDFETAIATDVVVLAIPLSEYDSVLRRLAPAVAPSTLIIDVCSVKVKPTQLLQQYLPEHPNILMTHPLFGPQSAGKSMQGHHLIVTEQYGTLGSTIVQYCRDHLGIVVNSMTAEDHDKHMANVHALTFFVARGLAMTNLAPTPFMTPSYTMILDLVAFDESHSDELFQTIEQGNPYASQARANLTTNFNKLRETLDKKSEKDS